MFPVSFCLLRAEVTSLQKMPGYCCPPPPEVMFSINWRGNNCSLTPRDYTLG